MPERYVTYDRWDAEHHAMGHRVSELEDTMRGLSGAEAEHRAMTDRIKSLEDARKDEEESSTGRRDRVWVLVLTLVSGVIFPILVTAVITFLHLRSYHAP